MRKNLALLVELAWIEGRLSSPESVIAFSKNEVLNLLQSQKPKTQWGLTQLALEQIEADVIKTLRVLRYGGRKPSDLNPKRVELLKTHLSLKLGSIKSI